MKSSMCLLCRDNKLLMVSYWFQEKDWKSIWIHISIVTANKRVTWGNSWGRGGEHGVDLIPVHGLDADVVRCCEEVMRLPDSGMKEDDNVLERKIPWKILLDIRSHANKVYHKSNNDLKLEMKIFKFDFFQSRRHTLRPEKTKCYLLRTLNGKWLSCYVKECMRSECTWG
jgi:hypothetical protein